MPSILVASTAWAISQSISAGIGSGFQSYFGIVSDQLMALALVDINGLQNWTDFAVKRRRDYRLLRLGETPFWVAQQDWLGVRVIDRQGRTLGRVVDVLVEARSLNETVAEDGDGNGWGVRAAYAVVSCRARSLPFSKQRQVFIPMSCLHCSRGVLHADEDLLELQPSLFGGHGR